MYPQINFRIKYFDKIYLVVIFFGLSPVLKWGVFDAAHQTLTVLQFTLCFYFLSKKEKSHSEIYFFSFILGLLALANMTFLICLFFLIFEKINAPYKIITNISSLIISCVLVVLPSIFWNQFIIYQGFIPYNAAIEYWKQFIWIKDFILAGYENVNFDLNRAEYYCMSIPLFLKCYLVDFAKTIFYLSPIIYLCILNWLKSRNKNSNKFRQVYGNLLFIYISLFIFWSFIGWYPPLRFNLYGLSYFLLFIYIIQILELTQKVDILFLASIYCLYFLYLNHWNNLNIVSFNLGIGAAILLMVIYSVRVYMESGKPISKF